METADGVSPTADATWPRWREPARAKNSSNCLNVNGKNPEFCLPFKLDCYTVGESYSDVSKSVVIPVVCNLKWVLSDKRN